MNFFRKSIIRRLVLYFVFFGALIFLTVMFFYEEGKGQGVPIAVLAVSLSAFLLIFVLTAFLDFVRPLKAVLTQMKALLTGRRYNRFYSRRLDEIGVVIHFFNEVTRSFEKASSDIKEGKRMMNELEIAAQIQKDILPPQNPKVPGMDVVARSRSAAELGGDNFDFITRGDNTFIYIGDVTGHGVPAAIIMTMVHTIMHALVEFCANAYDLVVRTNSLVKQDIRSTMFMTMIMLRWNYSTQKMSYVGAGHEHLIVYRANLGKCEVKPSGGIALGMVPDNSHLVKETDLPLEKDDVIILYTDGITEGRNMAGELYGLDRLIKAVEMNAPEYPAEGIVHHVAMDYARFVENHIQDDDVSLIALKYVGAGQEKDYSNLNIRVANWSPDANPAETTSNAQQASNSQDAIKDESKNASKDESQAA